MNLQNEMLSHDASRLVELYAYFEIPVPAAVNNAQQLLAAVKADIASDPSGDLRAEVAAGKVGAKTIVARSHEVAHENLLKPELRALAVTLTGTVANMTMAALRGAPDDAAGQVRGRFDAAVARLLAGTQVFNVASFEAPTEILQTRDDASAIWRDMGAALVELEQIAAFVRLLYRLGTVNIPQAAFFCNVTDDVELGDLTATWATTVPVRRWLGLYATSGVTPVLHTLAEAKSVVAFATANTEARSAQRRNKRTPLAEHQAAMGKRDAERWAATVTPAQ